MTLFKRKLTPVKRLLSALDEIEAQIDRREFYILKEGVLAYIKQNKKEILAWENLDEYKHLNPYNWVGDFLVAEGIDILQSGKYHIHRGKLNPLREGPKIKSIVLELIDILVSTGQFTEEEKKIILNDLQENIATSG